MADGQQGIPISDGFTVSKDDNIDKDYIQSDLAGALGRIPEDRKYSGKPIFVLDAADRGKYYMNAAKNGWEQFGATAPAGTVEGAIQLRDALGNALAANDEFYFNGTILNLGSLTDFLNLTKYRIEGKVTSAATFSLRGDSGYGELYLYDTGTTKIHINANLSAKISIPVALGTLSEPNANAQLDIVSTTKGFSKPRMSTAQRVALGVLLANVDTDKGMEVYDLDTLSDWSWDGTQWVEEGYGGGGATLEERIMFDSNLDTVREIYFNGVLTLGAFNIDTVRIATLEFETSTDGVAWISHGTIAASGTSPAALQSWINTNGSGNWYLRLSVVYEAAQTLPTGTQWTFTR